MLHTYVDFIFYRYFKPTPKFDINKEMGICTLYLPNNCPIQTVIAQGNIKTLKQAACLEACKKLHQIGALTDNLLPDIVVEEHDAQKHGNLHTKPLVFYYMSNL